MAGQPGAYRLFQGNGRAYARASLKTFPAIYAQSKQSGMLIKNHSEQEYRSTFGYWNLTDFAERHRASSGLRLASVAFRLLFFGWLQSLVKNFR